MTLSPRPPAPAPDLRDRISLLDVGTFFVGAALGTFLYRIVVEVLLEVGTIRKEPAYDDAGVRDGLVRLGPWVALVVGGLLIAGAVRFRHERATRRVLLGLALLGGGITFSVWGAVDMHGLGLYDWRPGSPAGLLDLVYHGVGALVAIVGYVLVAAPSSARDARTRT
jgi:uncharacterized membrane protein